MRVQETKNAEDKYNIAYCVQFCVQPCVKYIAINWKRLHMERKQREGEFACINLCMRN